MTDKKREYAFGVAADIKTAFPNATVFRALMESAQF